MGCTLSTVEGKSRRTILGRGARITGVGDTTLGRYRTRRQDGGTGLRWLPWAGGRAQRLERTSAPPDTISCTSSGRTRIRKEIDTSTADNIDSRTVRGSTRQRRAVSKGGNRRRRRNGCHRKRGCTLVVDGKAGCTRHVGTSIGCSPPRRCARTLVVRHKERRSERR